MINCVYVVVAPNPTGSWGWGQNLTDAAYGTWGSYIFWDIANCWQYVKDNLPFVDVENDIHAGASFGGYMSNCSLDYRLAEAEGIMLFNLLQQNGVPSKFLNFPDEGHVIENPANQLVWYNEIFEFINHYSGAGKQRPEPYRAFGA
ncbi:hypothetical protein N8I77_007501 [Diaporthe amygdali]|uniref:Dipeptidyl-peptidase V n=1 Tax=Phomopsis amygdali TaxID=1214568 RepID=A0AAD9W1Z5_PHOAM|nr:hypothetical protein N8I77_007501 [Diaporthe amygdali]